MFAMFMIPGSKIDIHQTIPTLNGIWDSPLLCVRCNLTQCNCTTSAVCAWLSDFLYFSLGIFNMIFNDWLVVSTPLKNSQLGLLFHILWKIKHVPNHQPDDVQWFVCQNHEPTKFTKSCPGGSVNLRSAWFAPTVQWHFVVAPHRPGCRGGGSANGPPNGDKMGILWGYW